MPVVFSAFHWQPVRSTNKIAVIASRSRTRGLWHPSGCGLPDGINGSICDQSTSGIRHPSPTLYQSHATPTRRARADGKSRGNLILVAIWTFMEHMELPAYRDGLLVVYDRCRFPVVFQKSIGARFSAVRLSAIGPGYRPPTVTSAAPLQFFILLSPLDRSPAGRSDRVLARREPRAAGPARAQASSLQRRRATVARREGKAPRPKAAGRDGVVSQKSIARDCGRSGAMSATGGLSSADRGIHRSASVPHSAGRRLDRSPAGRSDRVLARREPRAARPARAQAPSLRRCRATVARRRKESPSAESFWPRWHRSRRRRPSFGGTASRSLRSTTGVVPAAVRAVQPSEVTRSSSC